MNENLNINAVIGDLQLIETRMDASELLVKIYEIFEKEHHISGIIITKNNKFFKMLSRKKFFEIMSKQFMFDLFLKRTIEEFFFENKREDYLSFPCDTPVLIVANKALLRREATRHDPIIVEYENGDMKLLDFFELLLAQTHVHILASDLLKEANEFKKDVLSILGHDLRNPINAVLGFTEEIKTNKNLDCESAEYLEFIETAAVQMKNLVEGLIKSASNDALDIELSYSLVNLLELVKSVINSFEKNLKQKNQIILIENKIESLVVHADKYKLKEVLENLVSNAIKYSKFNKEIKIRMVEDKENAILEIKDDGPGFTEDDMTKVFGKFQRLSAKPTGNESSIGLGLYIVKKIITQHNGTIHLDSVEGEGSTFKIILPKISKIFKPSSLAEIENGLN